MNDLFIGVVFYLLLCFLGFFFLLFALFGIFLSRYFVFTCILNISEKRENLRLEF